MKSEKSAVASQTSRTKWLTVEEENAGLNFKPDSEHINALPQALRTDIHDLATRHDPSGDLQQIASLKEQRDALLVKCENLKRRFLRTQS